MARLKLFYNVKKHSGIANREKRIGWISKITENASRTFFWCGKGRAETRCVSDRIQSLVAWVLSLFWLMKSCIVADKTISWLGGG